MNRRKENGFGLIDLMASLVVIGGVIAAGAYYKGRPADDPKSINTSLPNFAEVAPPASGTNYFLEGSVHRVMHNDAGVFFMLKTPDNKEYWVVGAKGHTGGLTNIAAGQVGTMQVQANTGPSLAASVYVISPSQTADAFVYKYMVKTPAPANYQDPYEPPEEVASAEPAATEPQASDKNDE